MKYSILLALGLALSLPLYAGNKHNGQAKAKRTPEQVFNKKDTNHDGFLSKEEFMAKRKNQARAEKAFNRKDTNHDGKLSLGEFTAKAKGHKGGKGHKKNK